MDLPREVARLADAVLPVMRRQMDELREEVPAALEKFEKKLATHVPKAPWQELVRFVRGEREEPLSEPGPEPPSEPGGDAKPSKPDDDRS